MKIIFLDIDGVLNGHFLLDNGYCGILPDCIKNFNRIVDNTDAKVVLSSAWRYMISGGAMTKLGFEYMFKTHGAKMELIDITKSDEEIDGRAEQIDEWIQRNKPERFVIIDDLHLTTPHPFIKTESKVGLTFNQAQRAIDILNASE